MKATTCCSRRIFSGSGGGGLGGATATVVGWTTGGRGGGTADATVVAWRCVVGGGGWVTVFWVAGGGAVEMPPLTPSPPGASGTFAIAMRVGLGTAEAIVVGEAWAAEAMVVGEGRSAIWVGLGR